MKSFSHYLAGEVYKIFQSKQFLLVTTLLSILVIVDGFFAYDLYRENLEATLSTIPIRDDGTFSAHPFLQIQTLYNSWIGGRLDEALPLIFFFALPIFAVIPYSWTYLSEEKSGYIRTMVTRLGKVPFYTGKYISIFLSGFITVVIPMLISFGFIACLIPAYQPDVTFDLYYQVKDTNLLGNLYYQHPLVTAFISMVIIGVFAGIWATIPYVVSLFVKNKFVVLFAPYLVLLFLISSAEKAFAYRSYLEMSILDYIRLTSSNGIHNIWIFAGEMLGFFLIPLAILLVKGGRSDVY